MKNSTQAQQVLLYFWQKMISYKKLLVGVFFSVPLTILVNTFLPSLIVANVLSRLSQHNYSHNIWSSFGPALLGYFFITVLGIATWRLVDWFVFHLEAHVQRDIAEEVFGHMLSETADFHANNFSGSLVSQNNKLLGSYIRTADTTIFQVLPLVASIAFTIIILSTKAPLYVLLLALFSIFFILISFKASKKVRELSSMHATKESVQTGQLADAIGNVMVVKSFAGGQFERKRFTTATRATESTLIAFMKTQGRLFNIMGFATRLISALALVMAVVSVTVFNANIGTVFLILSYTSTVVDQLFNFSNSSLRNYNRSIGDAHDMVKILATEPSLKDPANPDAAKIKQGEITFSDVTFQHADTDDALFQKLNLHINPGEKVGLVGHSGSGKTTFVRLLLRFSDIDSGEILIDGQNIAQLTQDDLHSNIAYVPQEPLLFHRSIAENISYTRQNIDEREMKRAAKHAHVAEFVESLPAGYDTLVGERGIKLSGGQRQRVAIARALLKNAPVLVLDEATSALDSESEILIQDALWKLMEGRTAIVIAHRLSTIQKMDRIIVLENGEIIEQGSHKELLKVDGTYAKLWAHQSGGFIED